FRLSRFLVAAARVAGLCTAISAVTMPATYAKQPPPEVPGFSDVSVHDPSVIQAENRFYVFGSHGASAWTEDLRHWTQVASTVTSGNPPHFATFQSELSEL